MHATAISAYKNLNVDGLIALYLPKNKEDYRCVNQTEFEAPKTTYPTLESVIDYIDKLGSSRQIKDTFNAEAVYKEKIDSVLSQQAELEDMVWMKARWTAVLAYSWEGLFGYENYLSAIGAYPDKIKKLFEYNAEETRLRNEVLAKVYTENNFCKLLLTGQDICGQSGPMCSPSFLKNYYFPLLKYSIEPLLNAGFKIIWHSDGNILPILDLIIDAGVAGFQGFQTETGTNIDVIAKRRTIKNEKFLFFTGMPVKTLIYGTKDDVKSEIDHCMEVTEGGKGLFLFSDNTITPDAKLENIEFAYKYAHALPVK